MLIIIKTLLHPKAGPRPRPTTLYGNNSKRGCKEGLATKHCGPNFRTKTAFYYSLTVNLNQFNSWRILFPKCLIQFED
jgi:hypothetical protein